MAIVTCFATGVLGGQTVLRMTSPARPGGHRAFIDAQIREAQERGEFDNLPGKGKPLKGIDGPQDDLWWVRQLMAREELSYLPPALALRLEVERLLEGLGRCLPSAPHAPPRTS